MAIAHIKYIILGWRGEQRYGSVLQGAPVYLYKALPASTAIQSMAKSICLTKGDMRMATVWAALSTTLGCSRMILQGAVRSTVSAAETSSQHSFSAVDTN